MTNEQIIQMARQAGFERLGHTGEDWVCFKEEILDFAKLVAQHERERLASIADKNGNNTLALQLRGEA